MELLLGQQEQWAGLPADPVPALELFMPLLWDGALALTCAGGLPPVKWCQAFFMKVYWALHPI